MKQRTVGAGAVTRAMPGIPATARSSSLAAALVAIALLIGCESTGPHEPPPTPPAAPPQALLTPPAITPAESLQLATGSKLILRVPLTFPPGAAALHFQRNELVSLAGISRDLPYCRLAPASPAASRVIEPTTFTVGSVAYDDREIGSTGKTVDVTRIELVADPKQPRYNLSCQWPEGAPSRSFLTSAQIQGAIGAFFSGALAQ